MIDEMEITAKQARALAEASIKDEVENQAYYIMQDIEEAASKGQFECGPYYSLTDKTYNELESLGFTIERHGNPFWISW